LTFKEVIYLKIENNNNFVKNISMQVIGGKIVDIFNKEIFNGEIYIEGQKIAGIVRSQKEYLHYIMPGFVDAHIHIESSMLVPYEFARIALRHGTIATVSDPHEIANVCGIDGVNYMIENGKNAGMSFFFGAPSCVPATSFESAGAVIDSNEIDKLMSGPDIWYLSEMMNYPGVLYNDAEIKAKLDAAKKHAKPIDGHAPGLTGEKAVQYISHGISTDHECTTLEEAEWKLKNGMKILIREGSAAKNFNALEPLISLYPDRVMFCSDDKHPDDLMEGHINLLVTRALKKHNLFDILQVACVNPVLHYNLPTGLLRQGDFADFIIVKDLQNFEVIKTYGKGKICYEDGRCLLPQKHHTPINNFNIQPIQVEDLPQISDLHQKQIIQAIDGSLVTEKINPESCQRDELLQLFVVNRYKKSPVKGCYITGFGSLDGALASSVAHDSHNIVAIGRNRQDIVDAINGVISEKGGLAFASSGQISVLELPVAGLMHVQPAEEVASKYQNLDKAAKTAGCTLTAPYMTLSFMALLVIPKIKLSDLGLFDAENFEFVE
jgi:adenine deaminase